ncbi:MAG: D-aminoacylase [Ignavibacteria bacterium]|nr:D-aminoacylase [Ignavibacteria bacterium]
MDDKLSRRDFIKTVTVAGISTTIFGGSTLINISCVRAPFDTIIKNGNIIDGTGADEVLTDIGIRDGRIIAIGPLDAKDAERVIDASGLIVTPGFIDIHSHVDTELFIAPRAESKVRQGVTTEVTGADGSSVAPLGGPELERTLNNFREEYGFDCPYRDMEGFFTLLEQKGCAQNLVSLIGIGTVREKVVGMDNRPATGDEMEQMKHEVLRAIEQGCWGASTGLEYTPGSFASAQELWEIMKVVPTKYRLYATHMRNEDNMLLEAIDEAITIARNSESSLQVSHLKASYKVNWSKQAKAIEMLEEAIASGLNVHADRYPYIAYSTNLSALFPLWAREGGTEKFLDRLKDSNQRETIKPDVQNKVDGLGSWKFVLISWVESDPNKIYQGKTVQQISQELNVDPFEFVVDLMLEEETRVGMVGFGMDEAGTEMVLAWKNTMVCSDASSYARSGPRSKSRPHPRAYGTFPRAIAFYQRDRRITTLPDMIRKMTLLPAQKIGLTDRGVIAEGKAADIVIFDYETIQDRATFLEPNQFPVGIPYVMVNGVLVVDSCLQTDALPGRVLRSS